jgi:tRNA1Val (adenine37-N6)-methyltransferase
MKVCTDSCIFGAYVAQSIENQYYGKSFKSILDVGSGTGLLSLMLAQKLTESKIEAIEPDLDSFLECKMNFENSNWSNRLNVINQNLSQFSKTCQTQFEIIICNPPFFLDHLLSPSESRNKALHISRSDWEKWLIDVKSLLKPDGQIWILLPKENLNPSLEIGKNLGFYVSTRVDLHQIGKHNWRHILCFVQNEPLHFTHIETQIYDQYKDLDSLLKTWLSDFYLKL